MFAKLWSQEDVTSLKMMMVDVLRRGRVSVVWCTPSCLLATFSRDTTAVVAHNVGRAASIEVCGRRIMNPVGNTLVPPQPRWDLK